MSWRIVNVSNEARLSLATERLVIRQDKNEYVVPLEDIGVLMLESRAILLSTALLDACVAHKIAVFVCNEKHIPSGVLLGYQAHSRQERVARMQISWTLPFKKRLWQSIVKQKIVNQKYALEHITQESHPNLDRLIDSVSSGDSLNREATAARYYFERILPVGSRRDTENRENGALNYGYAIIRGAVARAVVSYGFLSSLGIEHESELNNFNLADDLMEPFRPFVDYVVFTDLAKDTTDGELSREDRVRLLQVLSSDVCIGGKTQTVLRATDILVQSLVSAMEGKDPSLLLLPAFTPQEHDT